MQFPQEFSGYNGIVLKQLGPHGSKFSVLTQDEGKVYLTVLDPRAARKISPGCLIAFTPQKRTMDTLIAKQLSFCESNSATTPRMLAWVHHILEITYYFSPVNQPDEHLFTILLKLIKLPTFYPELVSSWKNVETIGAAVLLHQYGQNFPVSPESGSRILTRITNVIECSIDFDDCSKIDLLERCAQALSSEFILFLENWILASLQSHPAWEEFKTIPFIYNIKNPSKKRMP